MHRLTGTTLLWWRQWTSSQMRQVWCCVTCRVHFDNTGSMSCLFLVRMVKELLLAFCISFFFVVVVLPGFCSLHYHCDYIFFFFFFFQNFRMVNKILVAFCTFCCFMVAAKKLCVSFLEAVTLFKQNCFLC